MSKIILSLRFSKAVGFWTRLLGHSVVFPSLLYKHNDYVNRFLAAKTYINVPPLVFAFSLDPRNLYKMVAQNMLRTYEEKNRIWILHVDVTEGLYKFEIPDLLHMNAPSSELPSNISTMGWLKTWLFHIIIFCLYNFSCWCLKKYNYDNSLT